MQFPTKPNAASSAVGHAFSLRKTTRVPAHTLIYVSQCEMRHSNPVLQHGFFLRRFLFFLSLFVTHVSPVCKRSQSHSLTSNFASSSPVFSISFYLPFFALHVCRLIHKLTWCFVVHVVFNFFFKLSWRCNFPPNKRGRLAQLDMHAFSAEKNLVCSAGLSVSFQNGLHRGTEGRTDGRTYFGRTVTS